MKNLIILTLFFGLSSCKVAAPTFKNLDQWRISKVSGTQLIVSNTAYLYNPNNMDGIKLNDVNLNIQTQGKNLGKLQASTPGLTIPKLSNFEIPISIAVNLSDLVGNVSSIIELVAGNTIDLRCVGQVSLGYSIFSKSVYIDQTIPLKINNLK